MTAFGGPGGRLIWGQAVHLLGTGKHIDLLENNAIFLTGFLKLCQIFDPLPLIRI